MLEPLNRRIPRTQDPEGQTDDGVAQQLKMPPLHQGPANWQPRQWSSQTLGIEIRPPPTDPCH